MLSFDIINIYIIILGSQTADFVYHGLIYYTIENSHLETLGGSVSFQCGINIFSLFIYKLHQQLYHDMLCWFAQPILLMQDQDQVLKVFQV
jgi:hypothetical protein